MAAEHSPHIDTRVDASTGTVVHVVASRQDRPNRPSDECPFCVGGLEAPDPYEVRWFPNRWPSLGEGRCEVVLYSPDHDASLWSIGVAGVRRVIDLWAERTTALRQRGDVAYVLVFENRGAEVGATIAHPHGQIYGFDHVPARPAQRRRAGWQPEPDAGERRVLHRDGWRVVAEHAPIYPVSLTIAPDEQVADLPSMRADQRDALAGVMVDLFERLDHLYGRPLPYMMWVNQSPTPGFADDGADRSSDWLNIEIVSPWRAPGVQRFIAAAEVATSEYFNPVRPEDIAATLRER